MLNIKYVHNLYFVAVNISGTYVFVSPYVYLHTDFSFSTHPVLAMFSVKIQNALYSLSTYFSVLVVYCNVNESWR